MLKTYLTGLIILIFAILLNVISGKAGITGWYDFLTGLISNGKKIFQELSVMDYIWLIILYPLLLGVSVLIADRLFRLMQL